MELEEKNAKERKELMHYLLDYLKRREINATIKQESSINPLGMRISESIIHLTDQNINNIRITGLGSGGCGLPGNIMRFQYEINLDKKLSSEDIKNIKASTQIIKEGKLMNLFGGEIVGIEWKGKRLANILNQDNSITDDLMRCVKSWSSLEYQIEAATPFNINIIGPRFTDPRKIAQIYKSGIKEEIECCVFGYKTVDRIAVHIKEI